MLDTDGAPVAMRVRQPKRSNGAIADRSSFCCEERSHAESKLRSMLTRTEVISTDPEILAGEPVFAGTRLPLRNLLDYLEAGDSLEIFLDAFPDVTRDQAVAAGHEAD